MVAFGYTLMCEQRGPRELVSDAVAAEQAGFDFEVISDHYFPWLDAQGHAPNAWAVLGAVAGATQRVPLMTYVTCPIMRYHPAVVAQQAATVALLAGDGRFVLGLGAGEELNEHVVGRGWPPANVRHEMLAEAVEIISRLFDGGYVSTNGQHYRVDSAKLWDLPESRVPLAVAVSGKQSIETFAPLVDAMVATEPESSLVTAFEATRPARCCRRSGSSRSRGARTATQLCRPRTSSSGGSRAVEGERRAAGHRRVRRRDAVRASRRRRGGDRLCRRAGPSPRTSRPSGRSSTRGSRTWRWCRSGARPRPSSLCPSPPGSCCPRCAEEYGKVDDVVAVHGRRSSRDRDLSATTRV